jgi:hypothetical protein
LINANCYRDELTQTWKLSPKINNFTLQGNLITGNRYWGVRAYGGGTLTLTSANTINDNAAGGLGVGRMPSTDYKCTTSLGGDPDASPVTAKITGNFNSFSGNTEHPVSFGVGLLVTHDSTLTVNAPITVNSNNSTGIQVDDKGQAIFATNACLTVKGNKSDTGGSGTVTLHGGTACKNITLSPPTIAGTPKVGQTLTATVYYVYPTESPTSPPTKTTIGYQWLRDGKTITGATKSTYKLVAEDEGKAISVKATATLSGYTPKPAEAESSRIPITMEVSTLALTINGDTRVGQTLTAKVTSMTPSVAAVKHWQWLRDGKPISGATMNTYKLVAVDEGKLISIKATIDGTTTYQGSWAESATTRVCSSGNLCAVPLLRYFNNAKSNHFYTTNASEVLPTWWRVFSFDGSIGGVLPWESKTDNANQVLVYRLYNHTTQGYLFTASLAEKDSIIAQWEYKTGKPTDKGPWSFDGVAFVAWPVDAAKKTGCKVAGTIPVYRFYNYTTASHFYTSDTAERDSIIAKWDYTQKGPWSFEGAAFCVWQEASATLTITGTPRVGQTLTAATKNLNPSSGTTIEYQWLRNGAFINGATARTYKLVAADAKTFISVRITVAATNYLTGSLTSTPTAAIAA